MVIHPQYRHSFVYFLSFRSSFVYFLSLRSSCFSVLIFGRFFRSWYFTLLTSSFSVFIFCNWAAVASAPRICRQLFLESNLSFAGVTF